MKLRVLREGDIRAALPMARAATVMAEAFAALSAGTALAPHRSGVDLAGGRVLTMSAWVPGDDERRPALASKTVSVFPDNPAPTPRTQASVTLLCPDTGTPLAIFDGTFLTAWRTGAASALATRLLAREDARVGAVIGCGGQAPAQVEALAAVRELDEILLWSRTPAAADRLATELAGRTPVTVRAAARLDEALDVDVVSVATTATTPVFPAGAVRRGTHINGVGSFTLDMLELDPALAARAEVFVDARESALQEAGELVAAAQAGHTTTEQWTEIGSVVSGAAPGRANPEQVTWFKSVGNAVQDAAAANAVYREAIAMGLGEDIEW